MAEPIHHTLPLDASPLLTEILNTPLFYAQMDVWQPTD